MSFAVCRSRMFISRRGTIDRDVKSSVFQHRLVYFPLYFLYVYYQNISKAIYSSVDISVVFKVSTIFVKKKKSKEFKTATQIIGKGILINRERAIKTNHPSYFKKKKERGGKIAFERGPRLIYALAPIQQIKKKPGPLPQS